MHDSLTRPVPSFAQARALFRSGAATPRSVLEDAIARIEAREPEVRAFVELNLEGARAAADRSTARWRDGRPLGGLDGCITAVKDIIETRDMPTRCGSGIHAERTTGRDAASVAALRAAGAIIIGKTVTTEFAIGRSGPTRNPHDGARTPGGSSSGSAAAVGDGMVQLALGTQTQGSVLRPASYCGAVGFKPAHGTLSLDGVHPLSASHDHLGLIAADIADVVDAMACLAPDAGDWRRPACKPTRLVRLHLKGWDEVEPADRAIFEEALAGLRAAGIAIEDRDSDPRIAGLEDVLDQGVASSIDMVAYDMREPFSGYVRDFPDLVGPRIQQLVARSAEIGEAQFAEWVAARASARMRVAETLDALDADGFVMPAASGAAPEGFEYTGSRTYLGYWSWLGLPAISLPVMTSGTLPWGLQIAGGDADDGAFLALASGVLAAYDAR